MDAAQASLEYPGLFDCSYVGIPHVQVESAFVSLPDPASGGGLGAVCLIVSSPCAYIGIGP